MQLTKKNVLWGESGAVEKPNDVKIGDGWTGIPAEQPPAKWFNWILNSDEGNINDLIDGNNVYDSELSSVITAAGLVPDLTPTGPGNQLLEAIQTGGLILNSGLADGAVSDVKLDNDLDFGHFISGVIDVTVGDFNYELDTTSLTLKNETDVDNVVQAILSREYGAVDTPTLLLSRKIAGTTISSTLTHIGLSIVSGVDLIGLSPSLGATITDDDLTTRVSGKGIRYSGAGEPGNTSPTFRTAVFELDNAETWTESPSTNPSNWTWSGTIANSGIPNGAIVLSASISYKRTGLAGRRSAAANLLTIDGTTTSDLGVLGFLAYSNTEDPDTSEPQYLTVVYDATSL